MVSSLGIFALRVEPAQAIVGWAADKFVQGVLIAVGYLLLGILWLTGQILNLVAGLISGLIAYPPGGFTGSTIVTVGWTIVRDLANMFFVLILLVIAFATILRIETYGMKALLPKLIIAALLINFSLVLVAPILDFTQILGQFFIEESGGTDFSAKIAAALNLSKISPYKGQECTGGWGNCTEPAYSQCVEGCITETGPDPICVEICQSTHCECQGWSETEFSYDWGEGAMDVVNILMGLGMAIVFSIIAIFAFLALIFFLIVRILIIWFLLILAPAAWLLWVLPATRSHFTKWWSTFIKWAFFAPAYLFFLYLALRTFPAFLSEGVVDTLGTGAEPSNLLPKLFDPEFFLQFILVLGVLLGGLIMAQQMGIYGAQGTIGIFRRAGRGAARGAAQWTGRRAQIAAARPAAAIEKGFRRVFQRIPILRQAPKPFRAFAERERAALAKAEEKYKGWTSDNLKSQFKAVDVRSKAAIARILASRGDLGPDAKLGFTEAEIRKAAAFAQRYQQHRDVLKARPDLSPLVKEDIGDIVSKMKPVDMERLQAEALAEKQVRDAIQNQLTSPTGQWRASHLSKMAEVNPKITVEIKQQIVDPNKGTFRKDVEEYLSSDPGKAIFG